MISDYHWLLGSASPVQIGQKSVILATVKQHKPARHILKHTLMQVKVVTRCLFFKNEVALGFMNVADVCDRCGGSAYNLTHGLSLCFFFLTNLLQRNV